jgi:hypothetical protein
MIAAFFNFEFMHEIKKSNPNPTPDLQMKHGQNASGRNRHAAPDCSIPDQHILLHGLHNPGSELSA